mgnify:CR=1 FL=1
MARSDQQKRDDEGRFSRRNRGPERRRREGDDTPADFSVRRWARTKWAELLSGWNATL